MAQRKKKASARGGLRVWGEEHGSAKLTDAIVRRCRERARRGARVTELAQRYGVSHAAMSMAISGVTWGHVPGAVRSRRSAR